MKIVINAFSARLGGGQTYLKNVLLHLPDLLNLDVLVFAPQSLDLPKDCRIRRGTTSWPTTNPLMRACWEKLVLPKILIEERANVLFCPGGVIATRVPDGCKSVTMFRNMIPFDPAALARIPFGLQTFRNFILKRLMLSSMARADLTIFISDYARQIIEALTRIKNSVTIPHGINDAFRTHTQSLPRPDWLPHTEYLLYVSRFDVYKHQLEVALAYAALPLNLRNKYKLLLVGERDQVLTSCVEDIVRERKLENQIQIVGPILYADLPAAYHHATVNLFASSCENCPNILLEALGAGRPVLSSNVMPMPEFGGNAVGYFDPREPSSICDALNHVLNDNLYREQLAAAAVHRALDFDWINTSRETWQLIVNLVAKK